MYTVTPEAIERARLSARAAGVFAEQAPSIAHACADATGSEIVVAVVGPGLHFTGVFVVPIMRLYETVQGQEPGGWSLVFSPETRVVEVELRCKKMARYAEARYRLAQRIAAR